jgi:hypothetical protein
MNLEQTNEEVSRVDKYVKQSETQLKVCELPFPLCWFCCTFHDSSLFQQASINEVKKDVEHVASVTAQVWHCVPFAVLALPTC